MVLGALMLPMVKGVFTAIAKTKQKTYKAMKGAFTAAKDASGAFGNIASALRFISPIIKVFNTLLKVIGASILKTIMPVLKPFLAALTSPVMLGIMEDIGKIIGMILIPVLMAFTWVLNFLAPIIKGVTGFFADIGGVLRLVGNAFIWFINIIIGGINALLKLITFGAFKGIPKIPKLQMGTDFVPRTGPYILHRGEEVIPKGRKSGNTYNINIDLRNAVVDNVDRLSQRIVEQVMIQIG